MSKRQQKLLLGLIFSLLAFLYTQWVEPRVSPVPLEVFPPSPTPPVASPTPQRELQADEWLVTRVIDGDTIELSSGEKVRYIGIDTPERADCLYQESTQRNRELVEGKPVRLEKDVSETDRYGRLLRYVYVGEIWINKQLVAEGFAQASSYPPDVKWQEVLRQAEQEARTQLLGLWGEQCPPPAG